MTLHMTDILQNVVWLAASDIFILGGEVMNIARHATMISSHRYSPLKTNEPGVQIATPLAQVAAAMITPAFTEFAEYQVRHQICFPLFFCFGWTFCPICCNLCMAQGLGRIS